MREDIRRKKYRKLYGEINDLYCNDFMNVKDACKAVNITPSTYYKICKELGRKSVGTDTKKQKSNNERSKYTNSRIKASKNTESHSFAHEQNDSEQLGGFIDEKKIN